MNDRIRNKLAQSKRRIERRLDKRDNTGSRRPMLTATNIHYEIADRTHGIAAGGMGAVQLVANKLGLAAAIDRELHLLKIHLPYHESDHVLNIAYNLLTGGTCNVKEQVVIEREFENIRLANEHVAEFDYSPTLCKKTYRVVVAWKDLEVSRGQLTLFDDTKCFFYITNDRDAPAAQIVFEANDRCDQENLIQQHKSGVRSLTAPVDNLVSNWAYMVTAGLAWSLKAWTALLLPERGRWQEKHREDKRALLRMDFTTFRNAIVQMPAQIVRGGRRIMYRLLSWNRWQPVFFRLLDQLSLPLRC